MTQEQPLNTADLAARANRPPDGEPEAPAVEGRVSLFPENELAEDRKKWHDVQAGFVDDPRKAVRRADELVATVMTRLAQIFADERGKLEHDWEKKGESADPSSSTLSPSTASSSTVRDSTEDLRLAFQRYRSFFDRLLSV